MQNLFVNALRLTKCSLRTIFIISVLLLLLLLFLLLLLLFLFLFYLNKTNSFEKLVQVQKRESVLDIIHVETYCSGTELHLEDETNYKNYCPKNVKDNWGNEVTNTNCY